MQYIVIMTLRTRLFHRDYYVRTQHKFSLKHFSGSRRSLIWIRKSINTSGSGLVQDPVFEMEIIKSSLGRYVFGSEISYNKAPPRLPGLGC